MFNSIIILLYTFSKKGILVVKSIFAFIRFNYLIKSIFLNTYFKIKPRMSNFIY